MYLRPEQSRAIEQRIAGIETRTGVQVVVALIGRCDRYPEARWKAFALGVAFAALAVAWVDLLRPDWVGGRAMLGAVVTILATGAVNALVAHYVPAYARIYVRDNRAEAEARQFAETLFLTHELFAPPARDAVLILVGLYERAVVVHADKGFASRVPANDWNHVVEPMKAPLRARDRAGALAAGLGALESLLERRGFVAGGGQPNPLSDRPIEERGA